MNYAYTTQVPNNVFDRHLPHITGSELKVLLIVIRQTYGWIDKLSGKRKTRDRISISQFTTKTGLSRRSVTEAISSLQAQNLIKVMNHTGDTISLPGARQGKKYLFYTCMVDPYPARHGKLTERQISQHK